MSDFQLENTSTLNLCRAVCGGSWFYFDLAGVRAANRLTVTPSSRDYHLGFRCARGGLSTTNATTRLEGTP